jgi:EAL domain-containing protein (putative c-di-GMP-specific phosphodiesterase class I)
MFYQPRIETNSQTIIGAESLIRIKKDNQIIPPSEFIEELEKSDYIKQVDKYILEKIEHIINKTELSISFISL